MKKYISALLPLLALAACQDVTSPPAAGGPGGPVSSASVSGGGYIVVLKEGANPRSVAALLGITPRFVYTAALNGFAAATLNDGQLNALRHNPAVAYVEPDAPAQLMTTQSPVTWGLDRIDQRDLPLSNSFTYGYSGKDVIAYVLDTGIN